MEIFYHLLARKKHITDNQKAHRHCFKFVKWGRVHMVKEFNSCCLENSCSPNTKGGLSRNRPKCSHLSSVKTFGTFWLLICQFTLVPVSSRFAHPLRLWKWNLLKVQRCLFQSPSLIACFSHRPLPPLQIQGALPYAVSCAALWAHDFFFIFHISGVSYI